MWFKFYNLENFYKIQKEDLYTLKKNDSNFLEKRIITKSSNLRVQKSKNFLYNQFVVLDKSFKNLSIFKYQNLKTTKYKKIYKIIKNQNNLLSLVHYYLNLRTPLNNVKRGNWLKKNSLCLMFPNYGVKTMVFDNKFRYNENVIINAFNKPTVNFTKQMDDVFKKKTVVLQNNLSNIFSGKVFENTKLITGGSRFKYKGTFFWSTMSLLNKGFNFEVISKPHLRKKKKFILI